MIHVYTGDGEGKTTTALGLALRALGHNKKVIIIQFMKGRKDIGEYLMQKKLPQLNIHQFGRKQFINLEKPKKIDYELANKGLEYAKQELQKKNDLVILDEACLACGIGLLKTNGLIEILNNAGKTEIVLTGRKCPKKLIEIADLVTIMKNVKHPYNKGIKARKGYDY